ncbi:MAG TPA: sulfatase [Anaerolineae bacterium]|nr:sulfatase [Anaerolineae bacterium]
MVRPNILYLHSHDTGRYVQPYGYAVPTPHIQQLAEQGVLFRQAFCASPTCSPSRAALLTGQAPHNSGMLGLAHRGFSLNDYRQHILHTLRPAGYFSAEVGMQHIAADPRITGYDRLIPTTSNHTVNVVPAAVEFLRNNPPPPFFLSVGFEETHRPFHPASAQEDSRYCLPPRTLPDLPETRADFSNYKASARILDDAVGGVLRALDETGLANNTLVLCTTDHGIAFPGIKCNLTDQGIGVMFILRGPGEFRGGQVFDALISHIDFFPTVCELLDIPAPAWLQGKSLLPLVRGEVAQLNEEIFAEVNYHAAYEPQRAVRTPRYKYIRRFGDRITPVLPNCDDSPSKEVWVRNGWKHRTIPHEQLFDLIFDPGESNNLASDPTYAPVLDEMRERMHRWMEHTNDPLLRGDIPAPAGARVNDPNGLSADEPTRMV